LLTDLVPFLTKIIKSIHVSQSYSKKTK